MQSVIRFVRLFVIRYVMELQPKFSSAREQTVAYYASIYLNVYPSHRKTSLLFHGVTGAIDEVDKELGAWLKKRQHKLEPLDETFDKEVIQFLVQRGHVTKLGPKEEWENFKKYVEQLHKENLKSYQKSGFLMLVPSYHCNLACSYCYQNPMRASEGGDAVEVMTKETVDRIFSTVLKQLYPGVERYSQIDVNLYGGEPFLERNRPALEQIFKYTGMHQMSVSAISNASSLECFLDYFGI